MAQATIEQISIHKEEFELIKPYVLSFATLTHFLSVQVSITLTDGRNTTAEVVPLPGYVDEDENSITAFLRAKAAFLKGLTLPEARDVVALHIGSEPFATSPLLTAIDLFTFGGYANPSAGDGMRFVVPTATSKPEEMMAKAKATAEQGQTLKVKLSGDLDTDLAGFRALDQSGLHWGAYKLRFDANQAYGSENVDALYEALSRLDIRHQTAYIEQPVPASDWDTLAHLIKAWPEVATMMDETVVTDRDLDRAIDMGIPYIKLKLFKQGGITELLQQSRKAHQAGIGVVLGNGVATGLSNQIENSLFHQHGDWFYGDAEGNGFLKVKA